MKILVITQHFPPEIEPSATKLYRFAEMLSKNGHTVSVVTGFPNYPTGIIPDEYKNRIIKSEKKNGFNIYRTYFVPSNRKIGIKRLISESSFIISAFLRGLLIGNLDFIFCSVPPLNSGLAALALSFLKGVPLISEIRDPFADAAVEEKMIRNKFALRIIKKCEDMILSNSRHIFTISNGLKDILIKNGYSHSKITVIYSGTDLEMFNPDNYPGLLPQLGHLKGKFIVIYSGNHGIGQRLSTLVKSAEILKDEKGIHFVFVGDGPEKNGLIGLGRLLALDNITFLDPVSRLEIPSYIKAADVSAVLLRSTSMNRCAIPTKIYDSLAMGKPIILSAEAEASGFVDEINAGICVPPENAEELAKAIKYLFQHPNKCREFGQNARRFAVNNLSREKTIGKFMSVIQELV
jgi:glycosyltransferase involved in cell wall biosynthesis